MGDRRREYRSCALGSPYTKEAPAKCRIKDNPGQKRGRQAPQETRQHVIVWQGRMRDQIEGRIREGQSTAQQIMSYPANGGFVFDRRNLDDVFM